FLEYDFEIGVYKATIIHNALFQLREYVERLQYSVEIYSDEWISFIKKYKKYLHQENTNVTIKNMDLLVPLAVADKEQNVANLSVAIVKALNGDSNMLLNLKLKPPSPFVREAEGIQKETVTVEEIESWIEKQ
ncbi:MAG TPA: hypothetical protein VHO69_09150, partial [Phototrophicaceae bacterium]|nr:hypothetical protein [Phototrophicaceae bacterium]